MAAAHGSGPADAHAAGHSKHLAHHFDSLSQQYQAGKTGMWLFLSTEILLFSGLFCAYAVYRHNHPEIFLYAHRFLDKTLGGINTLVLILSSFTAAWAVRAAQLGQRRLLVGLISVTVACGLGFMGIKAVEYEHKWKHGLLWGQRFQPEEHASHAAAAGQEAPAAETHAGEAPAAVGAPAAPADPLDVHSNIKPAAPAPGGLASQSPEAHGASGHAVVDRPGNAQVCFGIYFAMTGLHGIHVIAGMLAWLWVLRRAIRGDFGSDYFTPVDLVALYWHLVDLIWIYLFPLLYLIH